MPYSLDYYIISLDETDSRTGARWKAIHIKGGGLCKNLFLGSVRSELVESKEKRLSDYDITDRSTLALVARLPGGVWPTLKEMEAEERHLQPADGITLTTISAEHPDVMDIECDGPGVIMPCGHATAPISLAWYCLSELEQGKDVIHCPECKVKWKFAVLRSAACLTPNEITEFEGRAHINYFRRHQQEMNTCPKCGTFSLPLNAQDKRVFCVNCTAQSGKKFEFCWTCLGEWKTLGNETCGNPDCGSKERLFEILANCEVKKMNGIDIDVPSKRACPNCSVIIDHKDGCKHMTCRCCNHPFCFICLKRHPCGTLWNQPCYVAPRQTSDTEFIGASIAADQINALHNPVRSLNSARLALASGRRQIMIRAATRAVGPDRESSIRPLESIVESGNPTNSDFAQIGRMEETSEESSSSPTDTSRPIIPENSIQENPNSSWRSCIVQ